MDPKPSTGRASWLLRAFPAALFALLVVAVYADPLFTGRNFVGRDLVTYGLPMEKAVHDAWAVGRLPVWTDDVSGGRPVFANPNSGALFPTRPLLSRLPFPAAMRLFPILHWILAGAGMILLARTLGASAAAGWVAAATYVFSGVMVSEVFYLPLEPAAALHPWFLWALVRPASGIGRRAVPLGLVCGLLFLAGDAFAVGIALLAALLWIGLEVERERRLRELAVLGIALALGALLAAPQIVATALLVPETGRAVTGLRLREVLGFNLSPWRLAELVVPYPFGDFWTLEAATAWGSSVFRGFFVTLYCGAFAVIGFVALWRCRDRGARFCRALFLAGALLAGAGGFVPADWGARPSLIPLRFPEKLSVAVVLALAVTAGLAFDRFRTGAPRPVWLLGVAVALTALAGAAALFPDRAGAAAAAAVGASGDLARQAGHQLAGALAEAGLCWVVTVVALELPRRRGRGRMAACLALLTAVPIFANRRIAHTENEASVFPPTRFARTIALRDPNADYRTIDVSAYHPASAFAAASTAGDAYLTDRDRRDWLWATQALWGRGTVFNLDPDRGDFSRIESLRLLSGLAARQSEAEGARFFSAVALRFAIRFRDQPPLPGYRRFGGDFFQDWDENPAALPDVRRLERWREEPGALAALQSVPRLGPGEVVLETGRRERGTARPGVLRITEKSPARLVVETAGPDPTWLFALRGYWSHRTIRIDGAPAEAVPAQLAFSAVPVPAGAHRIEWREEVPGLAVSRWGPALFAILAARLLLSRRPSGERAA